jgi:hypothetical protein
VTVRDRIWPYLITLLAATTVVIVVLDLALPARAPIVLAFAVVCPGMALVRLMRLDEPWPELLLAIVVSLAVAGVVATIAVYLNAWNAQIVLLAIVGVTLLAVLGDLLRPDPPAA